MEVNVDIFGMDEFRRKLVSNLSTEVVRTEVKKSMFMAHNQVQKNLTTKLKHRTGTLARSMRHRVTGTLKTDLKGELYSDVIYSRIHEFGGTVVAKNAYKGVPGGPYLNVPSGDNLTAAGVMRRGPGSVFQAGGYIRRLKSGKYGVFLKKKDGKDSLMFVLIKSTTIKPQLGAKAAVEDEIPSLIRRLAKRMAA
jgi:phage gpG-like protein